MASERPAFHQFRSRLRRREPLLGTFVKLPTTQAIEICGAVGLDFVVIDQEHAPLDRAMLDLMILAARAANVAPVVRVPDAGPAGILSALDCGAVGVMVPHVTDSARAAQVVAACRYSGIRGFAGVTRSSGWGSVPGPQHIRAQDETVACIAMIEDVEAVDGIAGIAAVDGIDALFIGRGDLNASLIDDPDAAATVAALSRRIAEAACGAGVALMVLAGSTADAGAMRALGATGVLVGSDHNFLRSGALSVARDYAVAPG